MLYYARTSIGCLIYFLRIDLSIFFESAWHYKYVDSLIDTYNINSIILSTPGQKTDDIPFIYSARRKKISTVSPVYSWDNLTAKGPLILAPDRLVVWNEVMKKEACFYHDYSPNDIFVAGVPVFDPYSNILKQKTDATRTLFFDQIDLDPKKALITLTTIPAIYYGSGHYQIAELIKSWISKGCLPHHC